MALCSMTGYGRGEAAAGGVKVSVELGSVNRKQFDVRLNLPRSMVALESAMAETVHGVISRGSVTGTVTVTVAAEKREQGCRVDRPLAAAYVRELRLCAKALGLADDLGASVLVRLPEVVQYHYIEEDVDRLRPVAVTALRRALSALVAMRRREGRALAEDLAGRFRHLAAQLGRIEKAAPEVAARYREALRVKLAGAGLHVAEHDGGVMKDVLLFAERSDVSEEITRLRSHLDQAAGLLRSREPVGRTLDFLAQEMFREINTIGSKANDLAIAKHVIQFKTELERIREQVQNIE